MISVKYKEGDIRDFDFWSCSIWDWGIERIMDPFLVPHFQWDAQQLSKFDGTKYVRFIDEPTTADRFWDIQVCTYVPLLLINLLHHIFHYQSGLPPGGNLLAYILYADKTKLSSFGKAMGYLMHTLEILMSKFVMVLALAVVSS